MHRLFVAIRPPPAIRQQLLAMMGGMSGARWQSDDQLHITLRFIGEVDRHVGADIVAALGSVRQKPFELELNGLGRFGRAGQPGTLWAGLAPQEPLRDLHKKVDQACARAGIAPEGRSYHPHITLARLKRNAGSVDGVAETSAGLRSSPFRVNAFGLFESTLAPEGAVYTLVERYLLE